MNKNVNIKNLRKGDLITPLNKVENGKDTGNRASFGGKICKVKAVAFPYIYTDEHPLGNIDLRDSTIMRVPKAAL